MHYEVVDNGVLDQDLVVPVMTKLQKRFAGKIKRASFDRAFTRRTTRRVGRNGRASVYPEEGRRPWPPTTGGSDGGISSSTSTPSRSGIGDRCIANGNGQERCRDRSKRGYERYVGLGILGRNLQILGKLLLAQEEAACQAAKSKRKQAKGRKRGDRHGRKTFEPPTAPMVPPELATLTHMRLSPYPGGKE